MTEILPPYYASYGWADYYHAGSGNDHSHVEQWANRWTGEISNWNFNHLTEPGDSASVISWTYSVMQFYFQMPASGRLNAVSTLESVGQSYYWGNIYDEIGWSNAIVKLHSRSCMWIGAGPEVDYACHTWVDDEIRHIDFSQWWGSLFAESGGTVTLNFISEVPYAAGEWILLHLSVEDTQDAWENDMDMYGQIRHSWIIKKLDVTAIP
jgi:hypothetical protein